MKLCELFNRSVQCARLNSVGQRKWLDGVPVAVVIRAADASALPPTDAIQTVETAIKSNAEKITNIDVFSYECCCIHNISLY